MREMSLDAAMTRGVAIATRELMRAMIEEMQRAGGEEAVARIAELARERADAAIHVVRSEWADADRDAAGEIKAVVDGFFASVFKSAG